jgi:hypothetical protein
MRWPGPAALVAAAITACSGGSGTSSDSGDTPGYCRDVRPILEAECYRCHAASAGGSQAPNDLDTYEGAHAAAASIAASAADGSMPPGDGVTGADLAVLTAWAEGGAPRGTGCDGGGDADADGDGDSDADADSAAGVDYCHDIQPLLETNCTACHASTLSGAARGGAPVGIDYDTYELAVANAASGNASIQAGTMPPGGLSPGNRALFAQWIADGMVDCGSGDGGPDGGPDAGPTCTSGSYWTFGEGSTMRPGQDCMRCHGGGEEGLALAGTVFGALHDQDDCYGNRSVVVEITENGGRVTRLTTNSTGNFYISSEEGGSVSTPYTAKVLFEGRERLMVGPQTNTSCNYCHTEAGINGAPGRVVVP